MINNIKYKYVFLRYVVLMITTFIILSFNVFSQDLFNINNNALVKFSSDAIIKINGSINISNGATLNNDAQVSVLQNWTNQGTQNNISGKVIFFGDSISIINCNGVLSQFKEISIEKSNKNILVKLIAPIDHNGEFLSLITGTFKVEGTFSFSAQYIISNLGFISIPANSMFWLDNQNAIVSGSANSLDLFGSLKIDNGTFNVGSASNLSNLIYNNGSEINIGNSSTAILNVNSQLYGKNLTDSISYIQTGGKLNLAKVTNPNVADRAVFDIHSANSVFNVSSGIIEINNVNSLNDEYYNRADNDTVTGGKLLINSANPLQEFTINSTSPVGSLELAAANNPKLTLNEDLIVVGDVSLSGSGADRFVMNTNDLSFGANWNNNLDANGFNQGSSYVRLIGNINQNIQGTQNSAFSKLSFNKTGGKVNLIRPMRISDALYMVSNTILDLDTNNLTLSPNAKIYSDNGIQTAVATFSASKCIVNSGSATDPLKGAALIQELPASITQPYLMNYPISTPGVYTPAEVILENVSLSTNPWISVKPVPKEHPAVEINNRSLKKYWNINSSNITFNSQSATVYFYYSISEVAGNEGSYRILYFSPAWNNPAGYWKIDPGVQDDIVDFNLKLFYSQLVDNINGDWTAGEPDVARAVYFARTNGSYNSPATWSKEGFGGVASTTAPNKQSDKVRIQDYTVTIDAATAPVSMLSVENGTGGRQPGKLKIVGNNYVIGDTFSIENKATLQIGADDGITNPPSNSGNIRTTYRNYSSSAIYEYISSSNQLTGDGVPASVATIICSKPYNIKLSLSKNISIVDSLVINNGTLDLDAYSINGNSAGRTLTMRGGEIIVRSNFPLNYTAPTFTNGTITFDGTGNTTVPSSGSSPAVNQYNNLKITGSARAGNIKLEDLGEIRISDTLDLSGLNFTNNTWRFISNGTTFRFNKPSGIQNIPCTPAFPADSLVYLEYYNLIVDGNSTKKLYSSLNPIFKVLHDLTIANNSTLDANGFNLEIQGNWDNQSGIFIPGTKAVIFRSPNATIATDVKSRSTTDNPFNDIVIAGSGIVKPFDDILINGNLLIQSGSNLELTNTNLTLKGNWANQGGTFIPGSSNVILNGISLQNISKSVNINETFNNLTINNANNVNASSIGSNSNVGIVINGTLALNSGNLITRNRFATSLGTLTRSGGGFIDGTLRKNITSGTGTYNFEVGYNKSYTAAQITFNGTGGTAGLIAVTSDTITTSSSPISWQDATPTDILPAGSTMSMPKHVVRQWTINSPSGSSFAMGSRSYDATLNFVPGNSPNGDIRNSGSTPEFEARLRASSTWINPFFYGTRPIMGTRTASSTQFRLLDSLGTIIIGEPGALSFYTRASGAWNNPNNWSTQGYDGVASSVFPCQTTNNVKVYIGSGDTITLDANRVINNATLFNGLLQIDSSGVLNTTSFNVSGTGEFRLMQYGTLAIGDANGIRQSTAIGNIQLNTRNFNYNNHNKGIFIYNGSNAQTQANEALPQSFSSLIIDKPSNNITMNRVAITINDSMVIKSGSYTCGDDITLNGNFRRYSGTSFVSGTRTFTFSGTKSDTIFNQDVNPINFYNLTLSIPIGEGELLLWNDSPIQINNILNFTNIATNRTVLNARRSGSYVIMGTAGSITNASEARGWINGELRMNIPIDDAPAVTFQIGDDFSYSPFRLDFRAGSGSSAGYLAAKVITGSHPYMDLTYAPPIAPSRVIGPKYWRLTKPTGSTFIRGARNFDPRIHFKSPGDDALVDYWGCSEVAYVKKWSTGVEFQQIYDNSLSSVDGAFSCSDTKTTLLTPNYNYSGSSTANLANINIADVNYAFGNSEIISGDTLLGDFVAGNRNSITYNNFYSIKDGDWTDPSTWSTRSFNDVINDAATSTDPLIKGYPRRQYDNAIIGNGKRVVLNTNIGHNRLGPGGVQTYTLAGPSVTVRDSGTVAFGTSVLRCMAFSALKGSTIEIGSINGMQTNSGTPPFGNIITIQGNPVPKFNDSINVVYTASGYSNALNAYPYPDRNGSTHYIERFYLYSSPSNTLLIDNVTLDTLSRSSGCINYFDKKATLKAGQTYYCTIDPSSTGLRKYKVWIDYNMDGDFADTGEEVVNLDTSITTNFNTNTFTVPANSIPGSTFLRVGMSNSTTNYAATVTGSGEFENYTVEIINDTTSIAQITGTGMPSNLNSLRIHGKRSSPHNITLGKSITVKDSVKIISSNLLAGANTIRLAGDFVNDTLNGFIPNTSTVELYLDKRNNIRGSQTITFNKLIVNKLQTDTIINIKNNIVLNDSMNLNNDNNINLDDNKTITFNQNATINPQSGEVFSRNRMIKVSGNSIGGNVIKYFDTIPHNFRFTFPVGIDTFYNRVYVSDTASRYTGIPFISVRPRSGQHPNRLNNQILSKFWTVNSSNLNNLDSIKLWYYTDEIVGNINKYIPSLYNSSNIWEINLGVNPNAKTSPITVNNTNTINGDWTAGEKEDFYAGRIFFSRQTGNWNDPNTWSNDTILKHNGPPSSYYPFALYNSDTVNIDGHIVTFNLDSARIDTLRIGGTNPSGISGVLRFSNSPSSKWLLIRQLFIDNDNGRIDGIASANRTDTLIITKNLIHNSSDSINLKSDIDSYTQLKFSGSGQSSLSGTGRWGDLGDLVLDKTGQLNDTLTINSQQFAIASKNSSDFITKFNQGILKYSINDTLNISTGTRQISMNPFTGIYLNNGSILSKSSLTSNASTTFVLDGGSLLIGDAINENFYYRTGTTINLINGKINVAGAFSRAISNSLVNVSIGNSGEFIVSSKGNNNANEIGFDISNTGSSFTMSGGRIIVANAGGTSTSAIDLRINSSNGAGMTSGTIQIGDTLLTPNPTTIKIAGTLPLWNVHLVNNPSNNVSTILNESNFSIKNDFVIDNNHTFELNGNTLNLQGNLTNWGLFNGAPGAATTNPWQIILSGSVNQTIFNQDAPGIETYNIRLDKSNGIVDLSNTGNTNLIIRNSLEFATTNKSYIKLNSTNNYVELSPEAGSTNQVLRNGKGHINGRFWRWVNSGAQLIEYPVGADSIDSYRPVTIETFNADNTAGLLGVYAYNINHPDINNSGLNISNNIQRYWNIKSSGFALGANRKYSITTNFKNPGDLVNSPTVLFFEHRRFSPEWPNAGIWNTPQTFAITDSSVKSINNDQFGDFVVGEPAGVTFYSFSSGNWNDLATWSLTSYDVANQPTRFPNLNTDIVRIGNGKRVVLPNGINPEIRSVIVEKHNGVPGTLQIEGNLTYIRGKSFVLGDDCTLGLHHLNGITAALEGSRGAIQTESRTYGISRYLFNSNSGSQNTGLGLPDLVRSIIVDNNTPLNNTVFISNFVGSNPVTINDSVFIRQGIFNSGNRALVINGNMVLDSVTNDGQFEPLSSNVTFATASNKNIVLKNGRGIRFNDMTISAGTVTLKQESAKNKSLAHVYINNQLIFSGDSRVILGDSTNIKIENNSPGSIVSYSANRAIQTSRTSGSLIWRVTTNNTYTFPIGSYENSIFNYSPAVYTASGSGNAGSIGVRVSPGDRGGFPGGHARLSGSPNANYIKRYWAIDSVSTNIAGTWRFNYLDSDIQGDENTFNNLGRWRPVKEGIGGAWNKSRPIPTFVQASNYFETNSNIAATEFLGDWTIGNDQAFKRIFFSRQSGLWTSQETWTFNENHSGAIFGTGEFPNTAEDSVVIGGGINGVGDHIVSLDANTPLVSGIDLGNSNYSGTLDTKEFTVNSLYFSMSAYSTLRIGSADGISPLGNNTGNVRSTLTRNFSNNAYYAYTGTTNQTTGLGIPSQVRGLTINSSAIVSSAKNIDISEKTEILNGTLNLAGFTLNANNSLPNRYAIIGSGAKLSIGSTNTLNTSFNNYTDYTGVNIASIIEFNGTNQTISDIPNSLNTLGLGNVIITNPGTKLCNSLMYVRANMTVTGAATLHNTSILPVSLIVNGSLINDANIINDGTIDIGTE